MNGVNFKQKLVSPSKHRIKAPYSMKARKVTLHNTDNEASAEAEIDYMNRNNNQVSYHLAIDENIAIQGLPYNRNGWHSGDGGNGYGNRNTIGVEICRNYDRKRKTTNLNEPLRSYYSKAEQNAIKVVAQLCIDQGIVANNDNIKTHNDWNGKWCPSKILNEGRLQQVKQGIIAEYNRLKGNPSKPVTPSVSEKEDGTFTMKQVVDKTIAGGYGNGAQRKANIAKKTNFTYAQVQSEVNKRLNQVSKSKSAIKPKPKGLTLEQVVAKTIAGEYGNGEQRKINIAKKTNFSYQVVQDAVNKKSLGAGASKKPVQAGIKVGDTIRVKALFATSASTKNVRSSAITGYVDRIDNSWRNEIRLRNKRGGYYIGFSRKQDIA